VINDIERNLPIKFPSTREVSSTASESKNAADVESIVVPAAERLVVLDAGGGMGQLSALLAAAGHKVVVCDISNVMLEKAREEFNKVVGRDHDTQFIQCAAQVMLADF
jgi:ubiquinone/menaquinone biosynthesis C-methylase UbiE